MSLIVFQAPLPLLLPLLLLLLLLPLLLRVARLVQLQQPEPAALLPLLHISLVPEWVCLALLLLLWPSCDQKQSALYQFWRDATLVARERQGISSNLIKNVYFRNFNVVHC